MPPLGTYPLRQLAASDRQRCSQRRQSTRAAAPAAGRPAVPTRVPALVGSERRAMLSSSSPEAASGVRLVRPLLRQVSDLCGHCSGSDRWPSTTVATAAADPFAAAVADGGSSVLRPLPLPAAAAAAAGLPLIELVTALLLRAAAAALRCSLLGGEKGRTCSGGSIRYGVMVWRGERTWPAEHKAACGGRRDHPRARRGRPVRPIQRVLRGGGGGTGAGGWVEDDSGAAMQSSTSHAPFAARGSRVRL
eukprot:362817-Chlamydomonas_euryale.AAC.2